MKELKEFDIEIVKLSPKRHEYEFESGDSFFKNFEQNLIEDGKFNVKLLLDKSETMIQLRFHIVGTIQLICDRSLEVFDYPINLEQKLILKFGEESEELSDEIEIIPRNTQRINIAQYIFEFIGLSIPMKKLHPKFAHEKYEENEEGILVYRSETAPEEDVQPTEEEDIDPRWKILKNLNNN